MTVLKEVGQFIGTNVEELILLLVAVTMIFNLFFMINWTFNRLIKPKLSDKQVNVIKPLYNLTTMLVVAFGIISLF